MNTPEMQFLKYTPVTGEKFLGVAVIRWLGRIILRFKVMESTQVGGGYWVSGGSVKLGMKHDGKDNYEEWYQIDSTYDRDMIREFVLQNVEPILMQRQASVFSGVPVSHVQPTQQAPQQTQYNQPVYSQPSMVNHQADQSNPWGQPPF